MISVSHQPSDILSEIGHCVCNTCFTFLPDNYPSDGLDCVGQRVLIVIGNIVHHSPTAAEMVIGRGGATLFLGYVKVSEDVGVADGYDLSGRSSFPLTRKLKSSACP